MSPKMSSRDKTRATTTASGRPATSKATRRTIKTSSRTSKQEGGLAQTPATTSTSSARKVRKDTIASPMNSSTSRQTSNSLRTDNDQVVDSSKHPKQRSNQVARQKLSKRCNETDQQDETSSSSQEMTSLHIVSPALSGSQSQRTAGQNIIGDDETDIDCISGARAGFDDEGKAITESCASEMNPASSSSHETITSETAIPAGREEQYDRDEQDDCRQTPASTIHKTQVVEEANRLQPTREPLVLYHDDEEINQISSLHQSRRTSSDESEYLESGAALTTADDPTITSDVITFAVYPTGCCEFDETQLISANSTKAIQKCILRLTSQGLKQESGQCWGLDRSQPILMRILDDHIQFSDLDTHTLLRSQPIQTIKTWAVDDENNFAFVVEDEHQVNNQNFESEDREETSVYDSVDYALLNGPTFMCYVFSSVEDDDMSSKVAFKLNSEINRYRNLLSQRDVSEGTRLQRILDSNSLRKVVARGVSSLVDNDQTDADEEYDDAITTIGDENGDDDDTVDSNEITMPVRYIGKVQVPRPMGVDVLNVAIDKSLAEASKNQVSRLLSNSVPSVSSGPPISPDGQLEIGSPLINARIHVSSSSVIIENEETGDIIVECRIRYLTFMGISRRDIRWCGFIMQNTTNKTFEAHCIECTPTAGHVCEAIQASCSRMYAKMVKGQRRKQQLDEAVSIIPKTSKIRDTLAKTFSKIKLTPII